MATVLLPVTDHNRWTRAVSEAVLDTETAETAAVVLYVFTKKDFESTTEHLDLSGERPDPTELARRKASVTTAVESLETGGLDCRVRGTVVDEKSGDGILAMAKDVDADRIYMFSRKRSPTGKAIFGSQLQRVLHNSHVPVVVIPSTVAEGNNR